MLHPGVLCIVMALAPDGGADAGRLRDAGAAVRAPAPPPGLACLPKWYAVGIGHLPDGGWGLVLGDAGVVPYDDGLAKSDEETLESPDMEDTYRYPYRTGPLRPVTDESENPGRYRFDPLFRATYGTRAGDVDLVRLRFFGTGYRVHRRVRPAFERVVARIERAARQRPSILAYVQDIGGMFTWRKIRKTERQSTHSYGIAVDLNVQRSDYWDWQRALKKPIHWTNRIPQEIVDAFEAEGFIWGGRWWFFDTMHFEYRPELLDPECRLPAPDAGSLSAAAH